MVREGRNLAFIFEMGHRGYETLTRYDAVKYGIPFPNTT
jgi:hypothetical protein